MRRRFALAASAFLGALLALTTPLTVSAALLWTLTASPLAVATGTPTTFTLTASNLLLGRIECVILDVPGNFSISSVGIVGSTAGDSWIASRSGNRVTVLTTSGGDRLELLDSVTFTVSATAMSAGQLAWQANAYDRGDCGGSGWLVGVPPIVVVSGPAVTPSPVPTLPPTPTPLPVPTVAPTPLPTLPPLPTLIPSPSPTRTPTPTATPLAPLPSIPVPLPTVRLPGIPGLTPRPEPSPTALPTGSTAAPRPTSDADAPAAAIGQPGGGSSGPPSGGADASVAGGVDSPAPGRPAAPRIAFDEPELELGIGPLGLLTGAPTWVVPFATFGGPGLIVLLWVAAQAGGASIWLPAARRLRGEERRAAR